MNCPVCKNVALVMADRQGVEIDYCPECRGVWLDRGELDKVIERAAVPDARPGREPVQPDDRDRRYHDDDDDHYKYGRKKKRGVLGELFDF